MTNGGLPRLLAAVLVAVSLATGCTQQEPGTPSPSAGGTSGATSARPGTTTTTPRPTQGNAPFDPCSLLSDTDAATLGVPSPGRARMFLNLPACLWLASGQFGISIAADGQKGLDGVVGQNVALPKHKAIQVINPANAGGCGVVVEATTTSSALIVVTPAGGGQPEAACPRAVEVAKIVDAKLP
ncbi:DUF3558 domain-containing protein [Kibdelosporangium philippinense]|uniref:DUF3558 domain-containing protein n=1 Tax=Kibdelosporangium philippinense TaxID=211113 RepID=UPI0036237CA4